LSLTLLIVLVFTTVLLIASGRYVGAIVLAVIALPVLVTAARRMRRD
jgi:ABC-type phosphate transport system permease subunit